MTSQSQIRIWWDTSCQAYRVVTPYNRDFIEALKQLMPFSDRAWDGASKMWTISEKFLGPVSTLAEKFFHTKPTIVSKAQAESAQTPRAVLGTPLAEACEKFFRLCPQDAMQKAYRNAAVVLHPDHGGDMQKMSELNSLWQRISKELWS